MLSKKKKIIGGVCLGLAIFAAGGAAYFVMNGSTKNSSVAVSSEENLYVDGSGGTSPSDGKNLDVDTSTGENPDVDTSTQTKEKASTQEKSDKKTNADSKNSSVDTSKKTTDKSDGKTNNQKDKSTTQAKAAEKTTEQKSTKQSSTKQPTTQQQSTQQQTTQQPATTQPATTQPATTQPATLQPATSQPATTQPATEAPKQDVAECQHEWVWATKTIHHDAVTGTYEEPVEAGWWEPINPRTVINCSVCGKDYASYDDYDANDPCRGSYSQQERVDGYIEHPTKYETRTYEISPAYDETVNDYEYCSKCGKRK